MRPRRSWTRRWARAGRDALQTLSRRADLGGARLLARGSGWLRRPSSWLRRTRVGWDSADAVRRWTQSRFRQWPAIRQTLLAVTACAGVLVLAKLFVAPAYGQYQVPVLEFPAEIPLAGWEPVSSRALSPAGGRRSQPKGAHEYLYARNGMDLSVQVRYFGNGTGDAAGYLESINGVADGRSYTNLAGEGRCLVARHQGRAYLSVCLDAQANALATEEEFGRGRAMVDRTPGRIAVWATGRRPLHDSRCLWVVMSVPAQGATEAEAFQTLAQAWALWHEWWRPRMPDA